MAMLRTLGVGGLRLVLNSVGCNEEDCRPRYRSALKEWLQAELPFLCEDCQRRFLENPLRVFDCKVPADRERIQKAPTLGSRDPRGPAGRTFRCDRCEEHFAAVRDHLEELGFRFGTPDGYVIDDRLVRGLDYYVRTAFEVLSESGLGAQNSLLGGGRYDGLVKELGGPDVPGFGWAMGIERLLLLTGAVPAEGDSGLAPARSDLFIAHLGHAARRRASYSPSRAARGLSVRLDPREGKLGAQMKRADREGARFALIVGDEEIARGIYQLKDMASEVQQEVSAGDLDGLAGRIGHAREN